MSVIRTRRSLLGRAQRALASVGVFLAGCLGGQTGGEINGEGGTGAPRPPAGPVQEDCTDERTVVALADASRLGFSGADVLALALGTHRAALHWSPPPHVVPFGPELGESAIEMSIEYHDGAVRLVKTKMSSAAGQEVPALGCQPDRLEVDVVVRVTTAGGALDEQFTTALVASAPGHASLSAVLAVESLAGSFFVDPPAQYRARTMSVKAEFSAASFTGSLLGVVEQQSGSGPDSSVSAIFTEYARWPR